MQVLINISKKTYDQLNFLKEQGFGTMIDEVVANGKVLDNMTNGDVIKTMFPNVSNSNLDLVDVLKNAKSWWNAPYKAESEGKE